MPRPFNSGIFGLFLNKILPEQARARTACKSLSENGFSASCALGDGLHSDGGLNTLSVKGPPAGVGLDRACGQRLQTGHVVRLLGLFFS